MGALLVSGHAQIWELIALQVVGGAAVAFHSPASTGIVPETVPHELLQQANSFMSIARYAAFPLGAAVGGALVATIGPGYALFVDGATYGASALLLTMIHLPRGARPRLRRTSSASSARAGTHSRNTPGSGSSPSGSRSTS